jgi:hypothetical protein
MISDGSDSSELPLAWDIIEIQRHTFGYSLWYKNIKKKLGKN